ncbi:MAG: sulfatase family protein [Coraliomargarita sp.]
MCTALLAATITHANERPNVILIITDDQSWDSIGFTGGNVLTPRIDQMAKDGIYFSDFNVTSTVCSPSRYSFMTGRYAGNCTGDMFMSLHPPGDQTQIENIGELEADRWNLAKVLQANGYTTGLVGKSHLIRHDWVSEGGGSHVSRWEKAGLEVYDRDADPADPEVNAKMRRNHDRWCETMKPYGFDYVDGFYAANLRELFNEKLSVHNLEWTVSKALDFLEANQEDPFFLYFSTTLHHGPPPWENRYSLDADIRMTGEGFVEEGFDVMPPRADVLRRTRAAGLSDDKAYALWLDDGVGAILDKVEALGLSEETLILFVPDHGTYRHGKATLHDFGMRVPFVAVWKGTIEPGGEYDELAANIDVAPTIMELCGIPVPEDYALDGMSFKDALMGGQEPMRDYLLGELGHSRGIKTKDWKYIAIRYPEALQRRIDGGEVFIGFDGEPIPMPYLTRNGHLGHHASRVNPHYFEPNQLYNLNSDPEETDNVYDLHPEVATEMEGYLSEAMSTIFERRPYGEFAD